MKKLIAIAFLLVSVSVFAQKDSTEKTYKVILTETQISTLYQTLEVSKNAIPTSNIPMNIGVQTMKNIDSLEAILKQEYMTQQPKKK